MIRAFVFMIKVALVVSLAVWVANRPGHVRIEWLDYTFTVHVGLFLLVALATILLAIFIYRILNAFLNFPVTWGKYRQYIKKEKGERALTLGLTAIAAGDSKIAVYQAERSRKFLDKNHGLSLLLQAQAARLDGREEDAQGIFTQLLQHKDAAFLGVRGLLQSALVDGAQDEALELAYQAQKLHPKQGWVLRVVYDLEVKARLWDQAHKTLSKIERLKVFDHSRVVKERIALYLVQGDRLLVDGFLVDAENTFEKAYKLDKNFSPSVLRLGRLYKQRGKRRKAESLVKALWKAEPHSDCTELWNVLQPAHYESGTPDSKGSMARFKWFLKLADLNPDHYESHRMLGQICLQEQLWGEARLHFQKAEAIRPSEGLYKAMAEVEQKSMHDRQAVQEYMEKAMNAPGDYTWTCRLSGLVYEEWAPVAEPHGAFNTIEWSLPSRVQGDVFLLSSEDRLEPQPLLSAPKF